MLRPLILLFFLIQVCISFGQKEDWYRIIETEKDSTQANAYVQLITAQSRTQAIEALRLGKAALENVYIQSNLVWKGDVLLQMGIASISTGEKDKALQFYFDALKCYQLVPSPSKEAAAFNTLGRFYRKTDFAKSMQYYNEAFSIYLSLQDQEGIATILNESGVAFEYDGQYDSAIARYQASLAIQNQRKDSVGIGYSLEFLGGVFTLKGDLDKALEYNRQALGIRNRMQDSFALCLNYNSLATIFLKKKDWQQAIVYFESSNQLAHQMGYLDIFPDNYKKIATAYESLGKFDQALLNIQQSNIYKDSIFTLEKNKQIEQLNVQYETEKSNALIQQQQFDIIRKNYILVFVGLIFLTAIIGAFGYYKNNKRKQLAAIREMEMAQQELLSKSIIEAEEEERQRIARDLHDGVGQMMSAARMNLSVFENQFSQLNDDQKVQFEKIANLVDDSCKELRIVSHSMMPNSLIKNSLSSAVRNFVDQLDKSILKVQLYTEGLDTRLDLNIESVFYRVIQECVNNVIKHSQADKLDISIIKEGSHITAIIEDNGVGFDVSEMQHFEGIGLKNIITRVQYLKGTIEFDASPGNGTVIAIHIPTN